MLSRQNLIINNLINDYSLLSEKYTSFASHILVYFLKSVYFLFEEVFAFWGSVGIPISIYFGFSAFYCYYNAITCISLVFLIFSHFFPYCTQNKGENWLKSRNTLKNLEYGIYIHIQAKVYIYIHIYIYIQKLKRIPLKLCFQKICILCRQSIL